MRRKECLKTKFASEDAAKAVIDQIARKNQNRKKPKRSYHCEDCGLWHLTSLPDFDYLLEENKNLKNQIDELKSQIFAMRQEKELTKSEGREFKKEIKKEEMYDQLRAAMNASRKVNKQLNNDKKVLLQSVINLQTELESLKKQYKIPTS